MTKALEQVDEAVRNAKKVMSDSRKNALVIGSSISGLMSARVLSQYFENVTIVEKDKLNPYPESRKGQPQSNQLHLLLKKGLSIIEHYVPGITDELIDDGAVAVDLGVESFWYSYGGTKSNLASEIVILSMTRRLLEHRIRKRVMGLCNVEFIDCARCIGVEEQDGRVVGVTVKGTQDDSEAIALKSDLVIDAAGRGSMTSKWLEAKGYPKPAEDRIRVNLTYTTALYKRTGNGSKQILMYSPEPPVNKIGMMIFPVEDHKSIVCFSGWHRSQPDVEEGLLDFLKGLPVQDFYRAVS